MTLLQSLRNTAWLARLALLWFALTLGAAVASPLVKPPSGLVICTSAGMLKAVLADDGSMKTAVVSGNTGSLFCPLCLVGGVAVPVVLETLVPIHPLLRHVQSSTADAHPISSSAAPLPARGPPLA